MAADGSAGGGFGAARRWGWSGRRVTGDGGCSTSGICGPGGGEGRRRPRWAGGRRRRGSWGLLGQQTTVEAVEEAAADRGCGGDGGCADIGGLSQPPALAAD